MNAPAPRPPTVPPVRRDGFPALVPVATRWMDNDAYGHVNNVVYYSWFDTAVNRLLIDAGVLDITASPVISLVVESGCRYRAPIAYPDPVTIGVRVAHLGRSSVRYDLAAFRADQDVAAAEGHLVHVAVDRTTMRPVPISGKLRAHLGSLMVVAA
jgi:acyl-CoA thioester hydrolase